MPPKKRKTEKAPAVKSDAYIEGAGIVVEEDISDTLIKNYMPYAMSVIISRALPEIDGFKPSHRKLLFTMYKMGLLNGEKTKSANIVGQTMKLNPHGDMAIYDTMVRMTRGNEALLHPYVESKGSFGKAYSRDMRCAAPRYTEAKLEPLCNEIFAEIDKETVDFVPNYDNQIMEPLLLPVRFPSVLVNSNVGIAVSMASNICSFNLTEVCETCIALMRNPEHDIISTLKAPDFPGGGLIVYDENDLKRIYDTGRGSIRVRSVYRYNKDANCIEVKAIPPTTTVEQIIEKIVELVKSGKLRDITYVRDETDLGGLTLAIDLKRNVDPDALMQKLFRLTPLQDNYSANFNILIAGTPRVMGVREIIEEWTAFRIECIKRRTVFDMNKKKERLHLLQGLKKILLDIDKAIKIVRETREESEVIANLMIGFGIDEIQAEYVAEIKLRHLNREYILNRTDEADQLEADIAALAALLANPEGIKNTIIAELQEISAKYGQPRRTMFCYESDDPDTSAIDDEPDFPVVLFLTSEGYFKKITPLSLRMSGEHKLKESDFIKSQVEATNKTELLFFTDKQQVYKSVASQFDSQKASVIGEYIPVKLGLDEGESVIAMVTTTDYSGSLVFIFENGKAAKVPLNSYATKTNRRKLANAYSDKSPIKRILFVGEGAEILVSTSNGRAMLFNSAQILQKATRDTQGVQVVTLKGKATVDTAIIVSDEKLPEIERFRARNLPSSGSLAKELDNLMQLTFE